MNHVRDSGVYWLGGIPSSWEMLPAWVLFLEGKSRCTPTDPHLVPSRVYGVVTRDELVELSGNKPVDNEASAHNMKHVEPNDFIISMGSHESGIEHSRHAGKVSNDYRVLRPTSKVNPEYYKWFFKSKPLIEGLRGLTTEIRVGQRIHYSRFSLLRLPLPPLETQQRIADYLDRETAEIDAAVADLDRYVELLEKRRLAAEDAIIWGESVEYVRLKFLIDELDERAGQNRVDWPLLSVSIHNGVQERIEDRSKIQTVSDKLDHYKVVQTGDIVLNRMRAFQGALGISSSAGLTSPDYAVLRPHDESSAMWITLVMKTRKFVSQMAMNIRGIGSVDQGNARTPRINVSQLFDFKIPMPDKILRDQIVEMILRDQDELRRIVAESNHLRELLLKRRSVLITDVVTGRKQV